ncbi:MAG: hypothetical protein HC830_06125 [Bacteroidetes bacterium]|nr:hypothetical protein [Bacteroidota bacterium]
MIAGDDILLENCIIDNLKYAWNNWDIQLFYSEAIKIDEKGERLPNITKYYTSDFPALRDYFFRLSQQEQLIFFARNPIFLISPSFFLSRELLINTGGFDEKLRLFEDIPYILKCLRVGHRIGYFSTETVCYRIHSQSISKKKDKKKSLLILKELEYIYITYRKDLLQSLNFLNLGAKYEAWLTFKYANQYNGKGARYLKLLSPLYYYQLYVKKMG